MCDHRWLTLMFGEVECMKCALPVCDQPTTPKTALGLCTAHYARFRRGAALDSPVSINGRSIAERLWPRVIITPSCWIWTGARMSTGYGSIRLERPSRDTVPTHIWAYREMVGEVPEGTELDHLCRVKECLNPDHPDHLDPVPHVINARRGAKSLPKNRLTNGWYHPDLEAAA